jgi:hypothetical protein
LRSCFCDGFQPYDCSTCHADPSVRVSTVDWLGASIGESRGRPVPGDEELLADGAEPGPPVPDPPRLPNRQARTETIERTSVGMPATLRPPMPKLQTFRRFRSFQ